ncbi:conserved hypothetical protein [Verrucomicrobia bacterium]|nr:conserved hypothetical protein [Verrucomicrobiota bacterium]
MTSGLSGMRRGRGLACDSYAPPKGQKTEAKNQKLPDDPYLAIAWEQHGNVLYLHQQFAEKWPGMLFDIQEQRIYAYPYGPFAGDLSERSQELLAGQYVDACKRGKMVLFIRDNIKRKLKSYTMPIR